MRVGRFTAGDPIVRPDCDRFAYIPCSGDVCLTQIEKILLYSSIFMSKHVEILLEMFSQRGYTDVTLPENRILAVKPDGERIIAFIDIINKLNVAEIHQRMSILESEEITHGLLVYSGTPTPAVKAVVGNAPSLGVTLELWPVEDLQFNITKHRFAVKHELLDREETKEFKEKYGVNIPVLLRSDAMARFYDFPKGSVVKIYRKDFVAYRIVK